MQPVYLIASVATRLISILSMLILSHLMQAYEFGAFALINTNALALQFLCGAWLVSIANRALVSDHGQIDKTLVAAIASALLFLAMLLILAGFAYFAVWPKQGWPLFATTVLAVAFIVYDVTLAIKNALGREIAYARFALYRNTIALILSALLVIAGSGSIGPVIGMLVASVGPVLFLPAARTIWSSVRPSWGALKKLRAHITLGLGGALLVGIYILVNAPTRNIIAHNFSPSASGVWSLSTDLLYGPLAVIGNAYALSQVRLIYLAEEKGDERELLRHSQSLVEFSLAIAVPYAIGGYLFAADAISLVVPSGQAQLAREVAVPAAIQGSLLLILYSLAAIAFARRHFLTVAGMVISSALGVTAMTLPASSAPQAAHLSMVGCGAIVSIWLIWSLASNFVQLRLREVAKLAAASLVLWLAAGAAFTATTMAGAWIMAAVAGALGFGIMAMSLRLHGFIEAMPPSLRLRLTPARGAERS